jgi:hypothetical protein
MSQEWSFVPTFGVLDSPIPQPRYKHQMVLEGKELLLFGGSATVGGWWGESMDVHKLDLDTMKWTCLRDSNVCICLGPSFIFCLFCLLL